MKRILTYGTFDLLHYGHIRLLRRARALGDYLVVALSTDGFNASKGKKSFYTYETRKEMLEAIRYVDLVIPEDNWEQKINDVKEYHIDTVVMGGDWAGFRPLRIPEGLLRSGVPGPYARHLHHPGQGESEYQQRSP